MRILVTGANGYLGNKIVSKLRLKGIDVITTSRKDGDDIGCDLLEINQVHELILITNPNRIIHCAANVPQSQFEYNDYKNAMLNLLMLDNIIAESECPIIYISSMMADNPTSEYGKSKAIGEKHLRSDGRLALSVRLTGLFGLPKHSGLVYNTIHRFKTDCVSILPAFPLVWAAMNVNDAAESVAILAISDINKYETVDIGYRDIYSIDSFYRLVCALYDKKYDYNVVHPLVKFDLMIADKYGAVPKIDFRDAISKFGNEI
jgi:nucleoside-diphosphate-sugar epimerase